MSLPLQADRGVVIEAIETPRMIRNESGICPMLLLFRGE